MLDSDFVITPSDVTVYLNKENPISSEPTETASDTIESPVPITEDSDPFKQFLQTFAENVKKAKETQPIVVESPAESVERINEQEDEPIDDPLVKFLTRLTEVVKNDEKIENFQHAKEITTEIVNKIKEETTEEVIAARKKKNTYIPKKFLKRIPKQKEQPIKTEKKKEEPKQEISEPKSEVVSVTNEQDPIEEPAEEKKESNPYVQQLQNLDKNSTKAPKKVTQPGDIKSLIEKSVREQVNQFKEEMMMKLSHFGEGGGGGTVAVQYAAGGTMDGTLNVNGQILSGGRDISNFFGSGGGGGATDRLTSGSEELVLNSDGSVTFPDNVIRPIEDNIITLESENASLSAFTRVAVSPYAFFAYDSNSNSITFDSVDNSIVLTSQDNYEWTFNDKGQLVGPNNILTVKGTLSTEGRILSGNKDLSDIFLTSATDSQTLSYETSSYKLSISNGNFVSLSSLSNGDSAVNTLVRANSAAWNDAYSNLVSNSAAYLSGYDLRFLSVSSNWDSVYTTVNSNSSNWNSAYNVSTSYQNASGSFATTTSLQSTSSLLTPLTLTNTLTSQLVLNTAINSVSSNWNSAYASTTALNLSSNNWNSVYTTVQNNSATNWNYQGIDLKSLSGNWQSTYGTVSSLSAGWTGGNSAYTWVNNNSAAATFTTSVSAPTLSGVHYGDGSNLTGISTYNGSDVKALTGNWQSTYTTVSSNSANWNTAYQALSTNPHILNQSLSTTNTIIGFNTSNNIFSEILGGACNTASGIYSTIVNGFSSCATGYATFVGAGSGIRATGNYASVVGGIRNTASGAYSLVGGGCLNSAGGISIGGSVVGGGICNQANANYATVGGGFRNCANTANAFVGGGNSNAACGSAAFVGAGTSNISCGGCSSAVGGQTNLASGSFSTVVGGFSGCATGYATFVGAGSGVCATGDYTVAVGGQCNTASGLYSTIVGGLRNIATQNFSVAVGGGNNRSCGACSTILGGSFNIAGGGFSVIGGGRINTASGVYSFIGSGNNNFIPSNLKESTIVGGTFNHIGGYTPIAVAQSALSGNGVPGSICTSVNVGALSACFSTTGAIGYMYTTSTLPLSTANTNAGNILSNSGGFLTICINGVNDWSTCGPTSISATCVYLYDRTINNIGYANAIGGGKLNTASGCYSKVGGGFYNTASGNYNSVGGGVANIVNTCCGTIAGGSCNCVTGLNGAVGGGRFNCAFSNAAVAGGYNNKATNGSSAIVGGCSNCATGLISFVGGGQCNTASGNYSIIGGGLGNYNPLRDSQIVGGVANHTGGFTPFNITAAASISGNGSQTCLIGTGIQNCFSYPFATNNISVYYATANTPLSAGTFTTATIAATGTNYVIINGDYSTCTGTGLSATSIYVYDRAINNTGYDNFIGGGKLNTASGCYSTVGGGICNASVFYYGFVGGGILNRAYGYGTVGGGQCNTAGTNSIGVGNGATVAGGRGNTASGGYSTVAGGCLNNATAQGATVGGGLQNSASAYQATIAGGFLNKICGCVFNNPNNSFIGGGANNLTYGLNSVIGGGCCNTIGGVANSTIVGGKFNYNPLFNSDIHGGSFNHMGGYAPANITFGANLSGNGACTALIASGIGSCFSNSGTTGAVTLVWMTSGTANSSLSSACFTTANVVTNTGGNCIIINGDYSTCSTGFSACSVWVYDRCLNQGGCFNFIGGGVLNTASGTYGVIGGGKRNTASAAYSFIGGGTNNTSPAGNAVIGGGRNNISSGDSSGILAGNTNCTTGCRSIVGSGFCNTASGTHSGIVGGLCNTASGAYSFVAGGSANDTKGFVNTFILGTSLSASAANYTYVNNISSVGAATVGGIITSNYSGASDSSVLLLGGNTKGGAGYNDFLRVYNPAATSSLWFRTNNTSGLELLNTDYSKNIFSISQSGNINVYGNNTASSTSNDGLSGSLRFNNNNSQIYDDGNFHIHSRGSGQTMWVNTNGGQLSIGNQIPVVGGSAMTGITIGSSTTLKAFANIYGSTSYSIGAYGYTAVGGTGTGSGTTGNFSLYTDNRIQASEFDATSDERLKDVISVVPLVSAIDFVKSVDGILYTWKPNAIKGEDDKGLKAGFSAQRVHKAGFDHMIGAIPNDDLSKQVDDDGWIHPEKMQLTMNYDQAIPYHHEVIKHLLNRIEELEATVKELKK